MLLIRKKNLRLLFLQAILTIMVGTGCPTVEGQNVSASATLDSTLMIIGGQMNLTLNVTQPKDLLVEFPLLADTITKNIEIVEAARPDTTIQNNMLNITQVIRITSFDSGLHYIPPIVFEYKKGELTDQQQTNSLALMVVNPFENVDPQKGLFDIKQPINTPFTLAEILKYLHWMVAFMLFSALLVLAIHWWLKKRNPIRDLLFKERPKEPAHIIALRALEHIKNEKLWQKGQVKLFYSQLTDTLRVYMQERFNFPAMEQTTPEIVKSLKGVELTDDKLFTKMQQILETADLAKFAKYEPLPDENDLCLISALFFVNQTKIEEIKSPEEAVKESLEKEKEATMQPEK